MSDHQDIVDAIEKGTMGTQTMGTLIHKPTCSQCKDIMAASSMSVRYVEGDMEILDISVVKPPPCESCKKRMRAASGEFTHKWACVNEGCPKCGEAVVVWGVYPFQEVK